jgi:hypothetical protein
MAGFLQKDFAYFLLHFRAVVDERDEFFKQQSDVSFNLVLCDGNVGEQTTNNGDRNLPLCTC